MNSFCNTVFVIVMQIKLLVVVVDVRTIGHFRVALNLITTAKLSAKFSCENYSL